MSRFAPFFKCYSVYAASYASAVFMLEHERERNPELGRFCDDAAARRGASPHRLNNVLVMPVQRVPRCVGAFVVSGCGVRACVGRSELSD